MKTEAQLARLLEQISHCQVCAGQLPFEPKPVLQVSTSAKILIAGQAPGMKVQQTGIPFNDPSGDRLRRWLGVSREQFYDPNLFAIMPMGFCYSGKGKSGDLPPRPECADKWRESLLALLPNIELTLVIGQYALQYHLSSKQTVTEQVHAWRDVIPEYLPLPHPSPRNNRWLQKHLWFEQEVIPYLQQRVTKLIN
ncbi:uracil-DNA glycosylase family protein [Parashewanella curva]|uniref:Uracil-DNA glycosylase family protein n=1 Tax=Parashewanella curva TaxID=2338552 RepID=A0A3L8PZL2_9GAMM|nr:uracil-DNA glycosylase family protein [Parashewanella curva]RLV60755.1 uracil-DNA glycosylase family protein [Parashewanella curva]